jgi:hypothetical protein
MDSLHAALRIPRTRLALTGELHFPIILSASRRVPATLKIAASRAVQRRGSMPSKRTHLPDRSRVFGF